MRIKFYSIHKQITIKHENSPTDEFYLRSLSDIIEFMYMCKAEGNRNTRSKDLWCYRDVSLDTNVVMALIDDRYWQLSVVWEEGSCRRETFRNRKYYPVTLSLVTWFIMDRNWPVIHGINYGTFISSIRAPAHIHRPGSTCIYV